MLNLLSGVPGVDELRSIVRKVDTARHHGIPDGCVLELDLQLPPPEVSGFDPLALLSGGGKPLLLGQAVDAIHRAAEDERVAGLIARVELPAIAAGPVQELRAAIAAFSALKPSVAWAETYPGTMSYYLASAFREVWMQPSGTLGFAGFATEATFLRGALDKVGIQAQLVARGEYKSAAKRFTETGYTDAHREADSQLIESLHEQVIAAVAESRRLTAAQLDDLADKAPLLRDAALAGKLVDRIGYRDQAYARIAELVGAPAVSSEHAGDSPEATVCSADDPDAPPRLYLSRYARASVPKPSVTVPGRKSKPTIAVVTLAGPIVSGRGRQLGPLGNSSAGADVIAAALREVGANDDVSAVVVRVDSPGGAVTGSETIWREVVRLREAGKPVVASMGSVAASGGYYVAMAADVIVANPGTITGSIGVITGKLIARDLKERLGIASEALRTNANADVWSLNHPFTEPQRAHVEETADFFYDDFVARVAEGRKLTVEAVDAVAKGRVWTGADAKERGLVDELGGLRTAMTRAKVLAGLQPDDDVKVISLPGSSLLELLRPKPSSQPAAASLSDAVGGLVVQSAVGLLGRVEQSVSGVNALWLGNYQF